MMENPRNIEFCAHLLFCGKNVERIARALHHSGSLLHCARATLLEETAEGGLDQQQVLALPADDKAGKAARTRSSQIRTDAPRTSCASVTGHVIG